MSENEHIKAIKVLCSDDRIGAEIAHHADALAAQLAEERARAGRWKRLYMTIFERTKDRAWADDRIAAIADLRSHGDLPDMEEAKDE
jgi:hypothetical protein